MVIVVILDIFMKYIRIAKIIKTVHPQFREEVWGGG
jgi:hypothetical protein